MAIPFKEIPANLLVPGQYQEIDNSLAGVTSDIKRVLLVGYKLHNAVAPFGVPQQIASVEQAKNLFGSGSSLAIMVKAFLSINTVEELWAMPLTDPDAGALPWTQNFTVAAADAQAGSITIEINGGAAIPGSATVAAGVSEGDSAAQVAAAIVAAINSDSDLPLEADVVGDTTVRVRSLISSYVQNYHSVVMTVEAEGVTVTPGLASAATGDSQPFNIRDTFPAIAGKRFNYCVSEMDNATHINALAAELNLRFQAMEQIGGRAFIALSGAVGSKTTEGTMLYKAEDINSPHIVLVPRGNNKELPVVWATLWCAAACRILADDPAANTYDTEVTGLVSDVMYNDDERQKLLEAGIATYRCDTTGNVLVERLVTSYTENTDGGRDTSYLDVQVPETVDAIRTYINAEAKKRFKDWKLSSTEENYGSGVKVMTPGVFRSFLVELYLQVFMQQNAWVQDFDNYKKSIIVEVKAGSKTRLEYLHQPNLIGQFYIGAGLLQFK